MKIWKIAAQDDAVYVEAENEADAVSVFRARIGDVPRDMLTVSQVDAVPDGEELL